MATLEPPALRWLADRWERGIDSARGRSDAATFAGIVGDAAHRAEGGYHISREDQPAGNYSIADFSDDRLGRADLASAVDMTMDPADMTLVTGRLAAAWAAQDPRLDAVRAFNGTLDGVTALRWDAACAPAETSPATDDHLWHIHLEIFRRWADDMTIMPGILAVILGEQHTQEDDMDQNEIMTSSRSGAACVAHVMLSTYDDVHLDIWPAVQQLRADMAGIKGALAQVQAPAISYQQLAAALVEQLLSGRAS